MESGQQRNAKRRYQEIGKTEDLGKQQHLTSEISKTRKIQEQGTYGARKFRYFKPGKMRKSIILKNRETGEIVHRRPIRRLWNNVESGYEVKSDEGATRKQRVSKYDTRDTGSPGNREIGELQNLEMGQKKKNSGGFENSESGKIQALRKSDNWYTRDI